MQCVRIIGVAVLVLAAFTPDSARASPEPSSRAASLSAAIEGTLDCDIGEAGRLAHRIDYSAIALRPGRSVEYRRRVELERQLAAKAILVSANADRTARVDL